MSSEYINRINKSFLKSRKVLDEFIDSDRNMGKVFQLAEKIAETIRSGNKIISCGNGGSMCDAMHFAEELVGRFRQDRPSLPAIAVSDPSYITCVANDYGFEHVFARFIEGVGQHGDTLLALSTSGNSPNIIKALETAKNKGLFTVGLLGKDGGEAAKIVDLPLTAPGETSDRIQEIHIKILHISIEAAELILNDNSDNFFRD